MIPESDRAIAIAIDGNGRRVACDPHAGAIEAVLECAQNLACVGAEPLGLTNCLNFGNPEKPGVAWQLDSAVNGLAEACNALGVPVVGGNVSLYNETEHGPIYPTPVVGMVGELPDPAVAPGAAWNEGDELVLVGPFAPSLAGSELVKLRGELDAGLPATEIEPVAAALRFVREVVREGGVSGAHDVSDGGLARRARRDGDRRRRRGRDRPRPASSSCAAARARRRCSARGPGGIVLAVPASSGEALAGRARDAGVDAVALGAARRRPARDLGRRAGGVGRAGRRRSAPGARSAPRWSGLSRGLPRAYPRRRSSPRPLRGGVTMEARRPSPFVVVP